MLAAATFIAFLLDRDQSHADILPSKDILSRDQDPVVEQDVGAVQPGDHQVLVVARIAKQRPVGSVAVRHSRHVLVHAAGTDLQRRADRPVGTRCVQVRPRARAAANTASRSSAGVRLLGEVSGFCGTPRCDVWSKVMS